MEKVEDETGSHLIRSSSLGWISKNAWKQSQYISWKISSFQGLCCSLLEEPDSWKNFLQHQDPYHLMEIAAAKDQDESGFNWNKLTSFEKCVCLDCFVHCRVLFFILSLYSNKTFPMWTIVGSQN